MTSRWWMLKRPVSRLLIGWCRRLSLLLMVSLTLLILSCVGFVIVMMMMMMITIGHRIWRKAASHVVPLLRIGWSLSLCTPQQRLPMLFSWPDNPQSCPFPVGGSQPRLLHGSLGPHMSATQTASRSVQPFVQGSAVCPTDTQTDHATWDICRSRPHLCRACNATW